MGESEKCKAAGLCGRSCNRATETGPGASVEGGRYLSARMGTINPAFARPDYLGQPKHKIMSPTSQDKKAT